LALQHAQQALKLQPDNPQAAYVMGVVYAQIGKIAEAKQLFELILQKYPGFTVAADALKNIEAFKK
jgi:tetratricopeptide (TPR) repeat protein